MPDSSPYDTLIAQVAQKYNLDPVLFRRQLVIESNLDPNAVSPKGAQGIPQFMPKTARGFGINAFDPEQGIPAAGLYMRQNLDANNQDYPSALAAYNWGPGNLKQYGLANAPPETRNYINKIMGPQPEDSSRYEVVGNINDPAPAQTQGSDRYQVIGNINDPQPQQHQQQPPSQQTLGDTVAQPQQEAPPWYDLSDVFSSFGEGAGAAIREGEQTLGGQAFADQEGQQPEQQPRSFFGNVAYGLGHSFPTVGAGLAGGAAGAAIPGLGETGVGEVAGSAIGMAAMSAAQTIAPAYAQGRQQGMTHEQAVDFAVKSATTEGAISGLTAPLFFLKPFKSAVGNFLLHSFGTQPAVGAAARIAEPMITGQPQPSLQDLAQGAGQDVASGLVLGGITHLIPRGKKAPTEEAKTNIPLGPDDMPATPVGAPASVPVPPAAAPVAAPGAGVTPERVEAPVSPEEPSQVPVSPEATPEALASRAEGLPPRPAPQGGSPSEPSPVVPAEAPSPRPGDVRDLPPMGQQPPAGSEPDVGGIARPPGTPGSPAEPAGEARPVEPVGARPIGDVPLTLQEHPEYKTQAGRTGDLFTFNDPAGNARIEVYAEYNPKTRDLYIHDITALDEKGQELDFAPNKFGSSTMRDVLRQLRARYPEAKTISGFRLTRETPMEASAPLRETVAAGADVPSPDEPVDTRGAAQRELPPSAIEPGQELPPGQEPPRQEPPGQERPPLSPGQAPLDRMRAEADKLPDIPAEEEPPPPAVEEPPAEHPIDEQTPVPDTEGEEEIDTATAANPRNQKQLDRLNSKITQGGLSPGKMKSYLTQRNALAARRRPIKKAKAVNLAPPPIRGKKKGFTEFKINEGPSIYRSAWQELGLDPHAADQMNVEDQVKILRAHVKTKYNFRDVTIDPSLEVNGKTLYHAANMLKDLHRGMHDLMYALKMGPDASSLFKTLGLELHELTPRSESYGWYHPGTKTLAVYGRANVFGHEWAHAFDHAMSQLVVNQPHQANLATRAAVKGQLDGSQPLAERMGDVLRALFNEPASDVAKEIDLSYRATDKDPKTGAFTPAAQQAQRELQDLKLGKERQDLPPSKYRQQAEKFVPGQEDYWTNPPEMLARASEKYFVREMKAAGVDPRGVLMPEEAFSAKHDRRIAMTFPHDPAEEARIFQALDHLFDGYRQTGGAGSPAAAMALRDEMSDPKVWGRMQAVKKQDLGPLKETVYAVRHWNDTLADAALTDPRRPDPGARNFMARMAAASSEMINSSSGVIEDMQKRATNATQKRLLQDVHDRIGHTAGSGRFTQWDTMDEEANRRFTAAMTEFSNAMRSLGLKRLTPEQEEHVYHVMTTGETTYPTDALDPQSPRVPIDKKITNLGDRWSMITKHYFEEFDKAGFKIGFAKNGYFPRIYDATKAANDPAGFIKAAGTVYKHMFDSEVGLPGDNPQKLQEVWRRLPMDLRRNAPAQTQSDMQALAKVLLAHRKLSEDIAQNGSTPQKVADLQHLEQMAQALAQAAHDGVGNHISDIEAQKFHFNLTANYDHDWDKANFGGGKFLNARVLPPEADRLMRNYKLTNPMQVLPRYFETGARKLAYARRFGVKDEIREALLEGLARAGLPRDDQQTVSRIIDIAAGRTNNSSSRGWTQFANTVHAAGTMALMGRAVWTMIVEPMVAGLATGHMQASWHGMMARIGEVFGTTDAKRRAELSEMLMLVPNELHDNIMMNRTGADWSDSPQFGKLLSQYMRTTWITPGTNANRRAAVKPADWALTRWSKDLLTKKPGTNDFDEAQRWFNELGIAPSLHREFAQWKLDQNGMPSPDEITNGRFGSNYAMAAYRLNKRFIIDPTKMERPMGANEGGVAKLAYQFMTFNYGFQRNIIDPMFKRLLRAYDRAYSGSQAGGDSKLVSYLKGGGNAAWALSHTASIAGAYIVANMMTTALRQYIFNQDDWQKHEAAGDLGDYIRELAMSRSGLGGTLDPVVQVMTNLRYNQDIASLMEGPALTFYAKNLYNVMNGVGNLSGDTGQTNTRVHNAVKGFYNVLGLPLSAYAATKLAAFGPLGLLAAGAAEQYLSSPQFTEGLATELTGPKGARLPKEGEFPGMPEMPAMPEMPPMPGMPGFDQTQEGSREGISGAQGLGGVPIGFLDDFIGPATEYVFKPLYSAIPKPLKIAGAVGAGALGARTFWESTEKYRNAVPPKPKEPVAAEE